MLRSSLQSNSVTNDQQREMASDSSVVVQPVAGAAWRGRFTIPGLNLAINISAHASNKACFKVTEVASTMPKSLCMEMIPRVDTWPASFKSSPPTEHSIALFFFSKGRDEEVLDNLVAHASCTDFALKSMIGEAELLIFTSLKLPQHLHRLHGKPYFWGVFRGQGAVSHQSDYHVRIQTIQERKSSSPNSGYSNGFNLEGSPVTSSSKNSPPESAGYVDKRGELHDFYREHAKPIDVPWQQTDYKSTGNGSLPGGISHHEIHFGGGSKMHQEDWHKMSPEMKGNASDWVKNLSASKKKKPQVPGEKPERRGRPLDDAWGHAKALDDARQKTSCKYCGFLSTYGGISRLKAHLGGGCPQMQLQGCPQVPLEVKTIMAQWFNEWSKYSSAAWTRNSNANTGKPPKKRKPDDAWEHAIPLDERGEATRCKYCGFVSKCGGIARMKAHLGGGDLAMQVDYCPNVSPEIRNFMAGGKKKYKKKPKVVLQGTPGSQSEVQWCDKQRFVLQETLEEISNTSVKGRLQRLIEEKNGSVEKMRVEVNSLQMQLASMP